MVLRCSSQGSRVWLFLEIFVIIIIFTFLQWKFIHIDVNKEYLENAVKRLQVENRILQQKVSEKLESLHSDNDRNLIVIYNRVPKTASTSFVNIAYDICKINSFNVLHLNITGNSHTMSIADQARFVHNVTHWNEKKPGFYHGHVAFIDFAKFGSKQQPIYVNLLRKPLDRLVSYYYFLRYGDNYRPHLIRKKHGDKMTFDECVKWKQKDCDPENMWLQIPFLCGHSPDCWKPESEWALEEAKRNLIKHYLIVGITEELDDFISLLESTLPSFFKGASQHFRNSKKSHLRKTNYKLEPSIETINEIEKSKIWQMENELYEFAQEQFDFIKRKMIINKDRMLNIQQFTFEKISPK